MFKHVVLLVFVFWICMRRGASGNLLERYCHDSLLGQAVVAGAAVCQKLCSATAACCAAVYSRKTRECRLYSSSPHHGMQHTTVLSQCSSTCGPSGLPPTKWVDCGAPARPTNENVSTPDGTQYARTAHFSCSTGHNLIGPVTTTCLINSSWSLSSPVCPPVDCGPLTNPANGAVSTTAGTTYGESATYSCNTGYTLSGTASPTCQASGSWSDPPPTCTIVDCGQLTNPANGTVSTTAGTTYGESAAYSCNTGYTISGTASATCQASGSWSDPPPTCSIILETHITCGNLQSNIQCPNAGVIQVEWANYGRTTTVTCPSAYDSDTSCTSYRTLSIVKGSCDGQNSCSFMATKGTFHNGVDPCPNVAKYLEVHYRCYPTSG